MIVKFIKPIFLGMIAGGGALVFELLLQSFFPAADFSAAALSLNTIFFLIIAAAVEEFFKLLVIYKSFYLQKYSTREFLYSALLLGFGFALAEIIISNYLGLPGSPALYFGILGIILAHTLSVGLIGYLLLKTSAKSAALITILFTATLFHFAYNFAVFSGYFSGYLQK